jgi:pilus assembly protein Flp/PilA
MKNCKRLLSSFYQDETGQDLIEYALVAALLALGAVVAMQNVATDIASAFGVISTGFSSAV